MKTTLCIIAIATLSATVPMRAATISATFTGTVDQTQGATGEAIGSVVTGHFDLDSVTGNFSDFTIAGQSVAAGYLSSAVIVPASTDAIYTAQVSPVALGSPSNSTFSVDLSSLTTWPASDTAVTLLTDTTQLTTNLDTINNPASAFPSTFTYYTASSDGTNVVSLHADLTSITATTAVPEPATVGLLGISLLGLGAFLRRRK